MRKNKEQLPTKRVAHFTAHLRICGTNFKLAHIAQYKGILNDRKSFHDSAQFGAKNFIKFG